MNDAAKNFLKRKFVDWYARQLVSEMNQGTDVKGIDVQIKLAIMKPSHASWLIKLYNCMTSTAGPEPCMKG